MTGEFEGDKSSSTGVRPRYSIQYRVDAQQFESYLARKDIEPIRANDSGTTLVRMMDAIRKHALTGYKMGVFEKTIQRSLRHKWTDDRVQQMIITEVHSNFARWLASRPDKFGCDSLIASEEAELALLEEPSDFDATRLEHREDTPQGWLVEDIVPDDDAILSQGDGGVGKTTMALQLAVACATGGEWLGRPTVPEPIDVMFVSCEERSKVIRRRIKPQLEANGLDWYDLERLRIIGLADRDSLIAVKDQSGRIVTTEGYNFLQRKIDEHRPKLVIIDSLYDIYGGDENTRAQVRQFVGLIRRLTSRFNLALIVLGHPSLYGMSTGSGTSGSTGWRNSFRGMLYTTIQKNKNGTQTHKLDVMKGNYGPPSSTIDVIWQHGRFVPITADDAKEAKAKTLDGAKAEFMAKLADVNTTARGVSASQGARNFAPTVFGKQSETYGKPDFEAAMNALFKEDQIALRPFKTANRATRERIEAVHDFG